MKEVIISKTEQTSMVALLENGKLVEKYDEEKENQVLEGNIYCGIVKNILPGMQSAFIDIGEDKNAFIHIKDIIPKVSSSTGNSKENLEKYKIKDYLKPNMPILVQIKKDEENLKGARVSKYLSLTGRLSVIMPNVNFVTVSQKIDNEEERKRLKKIAQEILQELQCKEIGVILRTASKNKGKEEIKRDIKEQIKQLEYIDKTYNELALKHKPQLIFQNYDVISKFLTGVMETGVDRIIVNNKLTQKQIEKYMQEINQNIEIKVVENFIQIYSLETQIEKMKERKIWLKCGGFITIDKTEALTAIDVNSGKFTGKKNSNKENTVFKVNQEATIEIAKQIRLRNISGIIIIDYIDMEEQEDRNEIISMMEEATKKDRSKTQIMGFTKLDLLEMTRKKM